MNGNRPAASQSPAAAGATYSDPVGFDRNGEPTGVDIPPDAPASTTAAAGRGFATREDQVGATPVDSPPGANGRVDQPREPDGRFARQNRLDEIRRRLNYEAATGAAPAGDMPNAEGIDIDAERTAAFARVGRTAQEAEPDPGDAAADEPIENHPELQSRMTFETRLALATAETTLQRAGFSPDQVKALAKHSPTELLALAERERERQRFQDVARRRYGSAIKLLQQHDPDAARSLARDFSDDTLRAGLDPLDRLVGRGDADDDLLHDSPNAAPSDEDDRVDRILAEMDDQEAAKLLRTRLDAERNAREQAANQFVQSTVKDVLPALRKEFPGLRDPAVGHAVAQVAIALDKSAGGTILSSNDAGAIADLLRRACFVQFGPQIQARASRAAQQERVNAVNGQPDLAPSNATGGRIKLTQDQLDRLRYQAAKEVPPGHTGAAVAAFRKLREQAERGQLRV